MNEEKRAILRIARELLDQAIDKDTGQLANMDKIEEAVSNAIKMQTQMYGQTNCDARDLVKTLRQEFTVTQGDYTILSDAGDNHEEWWIAKRIELEDSDGLPYWDRYSRHLSDYIPQSVVAKLDRLTDDILSRIEDPNRLGFWDRRGLVVGQVQSGKTSNYTGLICKAVDAGYKLVIVLAGMHNNLRAQTQLRIDEGFLGFDTSMALKLEENISSRIGVGLGSGGRISNRSISLTTNKESGDFKTSRANNAGIPLGGPPVILVVKKNKGVLGNLINWVKSQEGSEDELGNTTVVDVPMLLIDDEADNASVNAATQPGKVAAINGKIRELLKLMKQSAYVGYTATPFANVFIEPSDASDALTDFGKDIYPEHFIVNIKAPSNYFGPLR
ncbi:endonuclease, partial [bacterium]|nr:endonuclease [bacterium]